MGAITQKGLFSEHFVVFASQSIHRGKFKHLEYSENVNFVGTNSIDSILVDHTFLQSRDFLVGSENICSTTNLSIFG